MHTVEISRVAKAFGDVQAVADVSFELVRGEIFGLLGPNGAGKTTTIRLMLDIFRPDEGDIFVFGGPMDEAKKDRIGYMPEERGLYQDVQLERCLVYLASLKGMSTSEAKDRLEGLLIRFDLAKHRHKKVKELSKGMQQKAQIINTVLHQPELVVIDEPFAALDPINTQLVKEMMNELREQGATILMSTHQMHQVEELCDRIVLINKGRDVLYGDLEDIRKEYTGHAVIVRTTGELPALHGVESVLPQNNSLRLTLSSTIKPLDILRELMTKNASLEKFEVAIPTLDEIFIQVVAEGS